ncbi:MAG: helix-turn-helix transcriptional regulator [Acidimicrobiales bacterium]
MAKRTPTMSRQATEAARLLGLLVAQGRREKRWTIAELAERAGVSKPTARKVELGDPTVAFGTALEMAALVGVPLFTPDRTELAATIGRAKDRLALLPERVRPPAADVHDDF